MADLEMLRDRGDLSDEEMTDLVARALLDPGARRPSIETLLHAFLPFRHIDHVHADAICALTNHADGPGAVREVLGDGFAYVDWLRPGFRLSTIVADLEYRDGVVLAHHGLITWGEDSDSCLRSTRAAVDTARAYFDGRVPTPDFRHDDIPEDELDRLLLHLRGALSRTGRRVLRVEPALRSVADRPDVADIVAAGSSSADHMLRAKPWSAVVPDPTDPAGVRAAVDGYADRYTEYVERHRELMPAGGKPHDPMPKVILVPGVGAITTGGDLRDARTVAEIAVHTHTVAATVTDGFGRAEPLPEREIFGFDYWPMELYKLALRPAPPAFSGTIVAVTGAASGIGRGIALRLGALGASLVLADLDETGLREVADRIAASGAAAPAIAVGDQSREEVTTATVRAAVRTFGGLDGVVLNAGIAVSGTLDTLDPDRWRRTLDINLTGAFLLTQAAIRAFNEQGCGGSLVYVASKNAFGPGAGFGAYSASKAGMIQLMRIAAMEGGAAGIRANAVNPDAVFDNSRLWDGGIREERAAAHGIDPSELQSFYAARNLLHREVTTTDVANAVAFLLSEESSRTTGAVLPVDGGVAAAFPR
jgi:rhamnose utilization protein RhaD (predicted bifunctional aldolase and dehydrogenase)/NAD(P)-dependent dehydrogenase (short-subunit alcohol dehydrogenase family)